MVAPDTFRGQSTLWPFRAITLGFKYGLRQGASWGVEAVHEAVSWCGPVRVRVRGVEWNWRSARNCTEGCYLKNLFHQTELQGAGSHTTQQGFKKETQQGAGGGLRR